MRKLQRLGWVAVTALTVGTLPHALFAADKSDRALEERVRALEKKVDQTQGKDAAQQQSVRDRIKAIEDEVKDTEKSLSALLGIEIHGLLAANYNYNFNTPESKANKIHVFDQDANSIALDQANINIQRKKPEGFGFNIDVDFGKTAEVVGGSTRWSNNPLNTESGNSVELRQAYVTYAFKDTPFSVQAGKFVTFHGAEVIKAYNNINYNISNSILFGSAIPFTHTGIIGTYALPSELGSVAAGVVNGWDNVVDNNSGKSVHGMLTLTPIPMIAFNLSGTYGQERDDSGPNKVRAGSKRLMLTPLITVKPIDQLTFIIDYNYGNESNVALVDGSIVSARGNAMWQGLAGYVIVAATDQIQVALRGEVFDDPDGIRTGFQEPGRGPGATLWEFTPTVAYKVTDGLTWRTEYRHDESDKRFFDKNERVSTIRGQDLLETELIYTF